MGIGPFVASAKLPSGTNAKLPKRIAGSLSGDPSAQLPNGADAAVAIEQDSKLPKPHFSAAERLRRLEEAKAFLRQQLATGPQPARTLLQRVNAVGIAERTLHRAKDLLVVRTERAGGYAARGQWVWYPVAAPSASAGPAVPEAPALASRRH